MTNYKRDDSELARTSPMVEPIHSQQPWESAADHAKFMAYIAEGPERTYKRVAGSLGLHPVTLSKLGAECRWVARAAAWDRELEEMLSKSLLARQIHARVEQADAGRMMRRLGVEALESMDVRAEGFEAKDAISLVTNGSKVESTALGVAEKHELEVTVTDPTSMTREEYAAEYQKLKDELDAKLRELGTNQSAETSD